MVTCIYNLEEDNGRVMIIYFCYQAICVNKWKVDATKEIEIEIEIELRE